MDELTPVTTNLTIRPAGNDEVKTFVDMVRPFFKRGLMSMLPFGAYGAAQRGGSMYLAFRDGDTIPVGGCIYVVKKRHNALKITNIVRRDGVRGSVGRDLFLHAKDIATGLDLDVIELEVVKTNELAICFYQRMGMVFYGDTDRCFKMKLPVPRLAKRPMAPLPVRRLRGV